VRVHPEARGEICVPQTTPSAFVLSGRSTSVMIFFCRVERRWEGDGSIPASVALAVGEEDVDERQR